MPDSHRHSEPSPLTPCWAGKPLTACSQEELIACITYLAGQLDVEKHFAALDRRMREEFGAAESRLRKEPRR